MARCLSLQDGKQPARAIDELLVRDATPRVGQQHEGRQRTRRNSRHAVDLIHHAVTEPRHERASSRGSKRRGARAEVLRTSEAMISPTCRLMRP